MEERTVVNTDATEELVTPAAPTPAPKKKKETSSTSKTHG